MFFLCKSFDFVKFCSNDIEDITDCMSRTFEDLGATIGANDYSKVEGRPEQFRENYSQV